jgi:hypothetical protein
MYFKRARRKDFESFSPQTNAWGGRYVYLDWNFTQCTHVSKHHIVAHKYVRFLCQLKMNKKEIKS